MNIYSITCTRDKNHDATAAGLFTTLSSYGVHVKVLANQTSIFDAYKKGLEACGAEDEDIVILCHDDLQIQSPKDEFIAGLSKCLDKRVGVIGVAGTTYLSENAVWWDRAAWEAGKHSGVVWHPSANTDGTDHKVIMRTEYGPHRQVVVLDGLFLAARKEVWDKVGLDKPEYFTGPWDFYDIHYTSTAHTLGYKNYAVPIRIIHNSRGELAGRDSWHNNRQAFINNSKLPLSC